mgnify:CR=1 FL=1
MKKLVKGDDNQKKRVYHELLILRRERNISRCKIMLESFVASIEGEFLNYFMRYYYARQEMWAVCFRDPELTDTNAHAEAFHRVLKHVWLGGVRNRLLKMVIMLP